jgi:hypothetical protein
MKQTFKKCLSVALLLSATALTAGTAPVVSVIKVRPQSLDNARKVAGEVGLTNLYDVNEWYANFDTTFEYQRSFRSGHIAECLFGQDLINTSTVINTCDDSCDSGKTLLIQGSEVANRNANALLADYFYLPAAFDGALSFKPVISSFVMNFNFYMGMDEWVRGMFFRIYAPFVHTKWDLNMSEAIASGATGNMPALRFGPELVGNANLLTSASAYFAGNTPPSLVQPTTTGEAATNVTIVRNPLAFHKMLGSKATSTAAGCCESDCDDSCGNSRTKNGFGEIRAELGWNFWQNEDYHLGLYLAAAAPTAGRASAEFLFDPYVGNLKHWELGGGIAGHYVFWRSEDEAKHFGIYMDTTVTHLFKGTEHRVFDLQGKPLSRYALAARVNTAATGGLDGTVAAVATPAAFQFSNEFTPVANLTAQDVKVSVGAQVDLALWLNFTSGGFSWDLGYDLWLQTCEKLSCSDCGPVLRAQPSTWVLAGDALVYGVGVTQTTQKFPLSVSESGATINAGTNGTSLINGGVDNPQTAGNDANATLTNGTTALNLSIPLVYLSEADISNEQQNKPLSNKIWTHFNYTWDREGVVPYFGIGGAAEFGSNDHKDDCDTTPAPTTSCKSDECIQCTVSQWQIWAKIGVSFD